VDVLVKIVRLLLDLRLLAKLADRLADTLGEALETNLEVVAVVEEDVGNGCWLDMICEMILTPKLLTGSVHGKVKDEAGNVAGTHPGLTVLLVFGVIKVSLVVEDLVHVEPLGGVVPSLDVSRVGVSYAPCSC
jgi:hypothetical protein